MKISGPDNVLVSLGTCLQHIHELWFLITNLTGRNPSQNLVVSTKFKISKFPSYLYNFPFFTLHKS